MLSVCLHKTSNDITLHEVWIYKSSKEQLNHKRATRSLECSPSHPHLKFEIRAEPLVTLLSYLNAKHTDADAALNYDRHSITRNVPPNDQKTFSFSKQFKFFPRDLTEHDLAA